MSKFPLFNGLTDAEVQAILSDSECEQAQFKSGEVIYSADKVRQAVGIILSGKAVAKNGDDNGVIVRCLSKGGLCCGQHMARLHHYPLSDGAVFRLPPLRQNFG